MEKGRLMPCAAMPGGWRVLQQLIDNGNRAVGRLLGGFARLGSPIGGHCRAVRRSLDARYERFVQTATRLFMLFDRRGWGRLSWCHHGSGRRRRWGLGFARLQDHLNLMSLFGRDVAEKFHDTEMRHGRGDKHVAEVGFEVAPYVVQPNLVRFPRPLGS